MAFAQEERNPAEKWEPTIQKFEQQDAKEPPEKGQVLFVGSSSIRLWDLDKWFPNVDAINRGFGGSEVSDSVYFFDRIVAPYEPRVIVMYAGDNDIAHNESPELVHSDFRAFTGKMKQQLPHARLVYVAIKPSIKRWSLVDQVRAANALIKADCEKDSRLDFLDIDTTMIGEDGQPKPELFVKDGLHLSEDGYKLWSDLLRPLLDPLRGDVRLQKRTLRDQSHPWSPPETLEEWKQERKEIRTQLLVSCGLWPMPETTPLHPVIHGLIDKGDYTIEKVSFESQPGVYVTGNLYRPKNVTGQIPGVLSPHGHWANGRFYDAGEEGAQKQIDSGAEEYASGARYPLQARMVQLARLGCVVFHYDMVGNADSQALPHRDGFNDADASLWLHNKLGLQTWNSIRALDFLATHPNVDPKRIAVTGASGGGTQTFMLCALDDRPAVAFPAVMVSTNMQGGCTCENADYLRLGINNVAIAAMFAPKPMAMTGADDWTVDIETKGLPELKQVYGLYGAADQVHAKYYSFPHNYNGVSRTMMLKWLRDHLDLPGDAPVSQSDFEPVPPAELSVYDEKHPRPADELDAAALRKQLRERDRAALVHYWKRGDAREQLGPALDVLLPHVEQECRLVRQGGKTGSPGEKTEVLYPTNGAEYTFGMLTTNESNPNEVILWVGLEQGTLYDGQPDGAFLADCSLRASIVGRSIAVVAPGLAQKKYGPETLDVDDGFPGYTFGYNRPFLANRVRDVQLAVKALQAEGKTIKALVAAGPHAIETLLARVQLPADAVERTIVDLGGFSFKSVTSVDDPDLLPGALKYGDIGGLVALAPECRIEIHGAQGILNDEFAAAYLRETRKEITLSAEPLSRDQVWQTLKK
ncbi:MAG: acetylxylan esterase [Planctomycetaceae bacterium]|nr:acetylxylan esterase [Planctomycetaceae bacterium]